jgi:hypothetical protein
MAEVPKILYGRMRAAEAALKGSGDPAHPASDLLAAFVEQALSAQEREGVLDHLSFCENCREVVALSLPPREIATERALVRDLPVRPQPAKSWLTAFTGPTLRWAALAAGIVIVGGVLLVRPGKQDLTKLPSANPHIATTTPPADQMASLSETKHAAAGANEASPKSEKHPLQRTRARKISKPSLEPEFGNVVAQRGTPAQSDTLEATSPALFAQGALIARNDAPPVEKAKPALPGSEVPRSEGNSQPAQVSETPALGLSSQQETVWRIAAGTLQRSVNDGQSWQEALHSEHPLLCYASYGKEVWTAGQAGILYHSVDNGITWVPAKPTFNSQPLDSDVTQIDLRNQSEITLFTLNGEIWSSTDGGNVWQKK